MLGAMWRLVATVLLAACKPSDSEKTAPTVAAPAPHAQATCEPVQGVQHAAGIAYHEFVLGKGNPCGHLPMVIAIHGLGDAPTNFAHLFDAWTTPLRLIVPRGFDAEPEGGYSWMALRARDPRVDELASRLAAGASRLAAATQVWTSTRLTQGRPVVVGFSQGGMLAFELAVHHAQWFAAAVPIAGWLPPPRWPTSSDHPSAPIFALHGTDDRALLYPSTQAAIAHLANLGFPVHLQTFDGVGHALTPEIREALYKAVQNALQSGA